MMGSAFGGDAEALQNKCRTIIRDGSVLVITEVSLGESESDEVAADCDTVESRHSMKAPTHGDVGLTLSDSSASSEPMTTLEWLVAWYVTGLDMPGMIAATG